MLKPLRDIILILPSEEKETTDSGLIVPEKSREKPLQGKVLAVGPGKDDKPMTVKVGDEVLYGRVAGINWKHEGQDCLLMRETEIFAVL